MVKLNIDLPESFFQEEERDGYLVSAKTKELWAVQLDLLNEFDRVCKKHNLKYILDFGTLLGAVRHKGFIPWDDDVDVSMLREDYEKLLEVAPLEFNEPYFLSNYHSEPYFSDYVYKFRRRDTTILMTSDLSSKKSNYGIFVDIFVYDSFPSDDIVQLKEYMWFSKVMHYRVQSMARVPSINDGLRSILRYFYYNLRYRSVSKQYEKLDNYAKQFNKGPFRACVVSCPREKYYLGEWFDKIIEMPFENLKLPVSANYDNMLKLVYGDYMTPVIGSADHSLVYFDTDRPSEVVMKDKALMKELKQKVRNSK